jgi:hypothetical protein
MPKENFLKFVMNQRPKEKKTDIWEIMSVQSGETLGEIRWWGAWRKYVFAPANKTIWDNKCMQEVQDFITEEISKRKNE